MLEIQAQEARIAGNCSLEEDIKLEIALICLGFAFMLRVSEYLVSPKPGSRYAKSGEFRALTWKDIKLEPEEKE